MNNEKKNYKDILICTVKDILDNWVAIICFAVAIALWAQIISSMLFVPQYTSSTTFVLFKQGNYNGAYGNTNKTSEVVRGFRSVLNSAVFKKKIAETLEMDEFEGRLNMSVVNGTNLITLSVTSNSPDTSFKELRSIIENHSIVSSQVLGSVVLNVFEQPSYPTTPSNSSGIGRKRIMGLIGGFVIAVLIVLIRSYYHNTIRSREDFASKLEIDLLETLRHESSYKNIKSLLKRKKKNMLITEPSMSFDFVETIKKINTKMLMNNDKYNSKVFQITSTGPSEGKTVIASNIALALSQQGKEVLLIEGDSSQVELISLFNCNPEIGMTYDNYYHDYMSAVQRVSGTRLYILGNCEANPGGEKIYSSKSFADFMNQAKERFDYVIIDGSCVEGRYDVLETVKYADATVFVVKQNYQTVDKINEAIDTLSFYGRGVIGCVFNDKIHVSALSSPLGYGYGYGYGYGHYGYGYGSYGRYRGQYGNYTGHYGRYAHNTTSE